MKGNKIFYQTNNDYGRGKKSFYKHSFGLKGSKSGTWFHLVPKSEKAQDAFDDVLICLHSSGEVQVRHGLIFVISGSI